MLYRAIYELSMIHTAACEHVDSRYLNLIESCEGRDIVSKGIALLGCGGLHLSPHEYEKTLRSER